MPSHVIGQMNVTGFAHLELPTAILPRTNMYCKQAPWVPRLPLSGFQHHSGLCYSQMAKTQPRL